MKHSPENMIFVEGKDDSLFLQFLLSHLWDLPNHQIKEHIPSIIIDHNTVISNVGGVDNFRKAFAQPLPSYTIKKIVVFADTDQHSVEKTFKEKITPALQILKNNIEKNSVEEVEITLPTKPSCYSIGSPQIGVFLFPDNTRSGILEDLCLSITHEKDIKRMACINAFIEEIKKEYPDDFPKNLSKALLAVFISRIFLYTMPKLTSNVGIGAQEKYWNFDHTNLTPLKNFLNDLKKITHHA